MADDRAAAKRRASFGRADRLRKEAGQKKEQAATVQRRKSERDQADQARKAEAVRAAEQRTALARKQAEQRRVERQKESLRKEFARKADQRQPQVKPAVAVKQQPAAERGPHDKAARAYAGREEQRQLADQRIEHRRQTDRLRTEQQARRENFQHQQAGLIINHARHIRDIDHAERRDLAAHDLRRHSLGGRVTALVRGSQHFARQEAAIVERHENARWQKHREHEGKNDGLFWTQQATRHAHVVERANLTKAHQTERRDLVQAHHRTRPQRVQEHAKALERAARAPVERTVAQDNARPKPAFDHAAGRGHERSR